MVRAVKLGEVAEFVRGVTYKPTDVTTADDPSGIPCLRTKNIQEKLEDEDLVFIPKAPIKDSKLVSEGDILVSSANSWNLVGKCSWVPTLPYKATFGGFTSVLRSNQSTVDPRYLYRWFSSPRIQELARSFGQQTTNISNLNQGRCLELEIPLPPLDEQKRIAAILDKADQLRQKRRQAIALLDSLTQSIFLEMFGDPVSNPKGWPVLPFGALAKNCDSIRVPVKQSDRDKRSGPYPYYGSVGVIDDIDGFLFEGEHLLISEDGKHLQSRSRPIACIANGKFWVNNHAHVVKSNGRSDLLFLRSFFEISSIDKYISGIDQIKLNRKSLDDISIPLPPIHMQEEYRAVITKLEIQKKKLNQMDERLIDIFASLQHRAFSGQL
nr:restriction endonuclease subunit S [Rhizobium leguminosarum]